MKHRFLQIASPVLLLALLYFTTGRLGLMFPAWGSHITLIWLPTGIAVAAFLRFGFRCWPGVALGAMAVDFSLGMAWPAAVGVAVDRQPRVPAVGRGRLPGRTASSDILPVAQDFHLGQRQEFGPVDHLDADELSENAGALGREGTNAQSV